MAGGGGGEEGEFGLQIAPMLDVMFVLLLFFMVAAGAAASKEGELGIKIPGETKGAISDTDNNTPIIITIDVLGNIAINNSNAADPLDNDLTALRERLKGMIEGMGSGETPVIVAPDPKATHNRVIQVLDACSYAKVQKLTFRYAGSGKGAGH
ncbi:MAG: biopolymer transporter ExbD [Verrucomicrobiales bacterium]|jgi:biopolymer transport protein ExbD|nr:biopolymer transporter ExbD [Verrucomicrobiales bacterium]